MMRYDYHFKAALQDSDKTLQAGRIPEFDALAAKFFAATSNIRSSLLDEATLLAKSVGETSQQYLKVMSKVVNGSEDYLHKESTRLASILKKRTLSDKKLDEIKVKANILAAFSEQKPEVADEEADSTAKKASGEL